MLTAALPLMIYVISAALLYAETCMIAAALDALRHVRRPLHRRMTICLLLIPLVVLPAVPVVMLVSLGHGCTATVRTLLYAAGLWVGGLVAAALAYWYARRNAVAPAASRAEE